MFDPNAFPTHMIIKSAKYVKKLAGSSEYDTVAVVVDRNGVDETWFVPINLRNADYVELQRQVSAGGVTIGNPD